MPPPGIPCPSCGKAFFASSLKFHVAKCQQKQATMMVECPACSMQVPGAELNQHMAKCKAAQKKFEGGPRQSSQRTSSGQRGGRAGSAAPPRAPPMAIQPQTLDGRVPCGRCGRKFSPDRIAKHQYICTGLKHGPPRRTSGNASMSSALARVAPGRRPGCPK